jgi:arylsulfatase A-like enzyme
VVSTGLDLLPTLCDLAGIDAPGDVQGRSLRPFLEGSEVSSWRRDVVVETQTSIGEGPGGAATGRALVGERCKYSVYTMGRWREQLVDLDNDPGEMVNLAVERRHQDLLQSCRDRLRAWCEETGDDDGLKLLP